MAFQTGSAIRPELSSVNYAPWLEAAGRGAQMEAQGIAALGGGIARGVETFVDTYVKNKEQEKEYQGIIKAADTFSKGIEPIAGQLNPGLVAAITDLRNQISDPNTSSRTKATAAKMFMQQAPGVLNLGMQATQIKRDAEEAEERKKLNAINLRMVALKEAEALKDAADEEAFGRAWKATPLEKEERKVVSEFRPQLVGDEGEFIERTRTKQVPVPIEQSEYDAHMANMDRAASIIQQLDAIKGVESARPPPNWFDLGRAKPQPESVSSRRNALMEELKRIDMSGPQQKFTTVTENIPESELPKIETFVEQLSKRPLSGDEKVEAFLNVYEGRVTPRLLKQVRETFADDVKLVPSGVPGYGVLKTSSGGAQVVPTAPKEPNIGQQQMGAADELARMIEFYSEIVPWIGIPQSDRGKMIRLGIEAGPKYKYPDALTGNALAIPEAFEKIREAMGHAPAKPEAPIQKPITPIQKPIKGLPKNQPPPIRDGQLCVDKTGKVVAVGKGGVWVDEI